MIKDIISYLYHKYVTRPSYDPHMDEEEYLEICKEYYMLRKYYVIKTFEKQQMVEQVANINHKMKKYI